MLFRFGVILTPECPETEVFVLGSRPEMGQWDPDRAVQMKASQKLVSPHEPSLWVGDVQLAEPFKDTLWFKFVKRVRGACVWEGTRERCAPERRVLRLRRRSRIKLLPSRAAVTF